MICLETNDNDFFFSVGNSAWKISWVMLTPIKMINPFFTNLRSLSNTYKKMINPFFTDLRSLSNTYKNGQSIFYTFKVSFDDL